MSRSNRILCASLALAVSLPAFAEKPRLVVVSLASGDGASEVAAGKFQRLLVDELKTRGEAVDLATPPAVKATAEKPASGGKRGPSTEAVNALDAGRKAFDDLRFEDATASLKKAIDGLLGDPASADFEWVTDAYVKLAAAYFRMGEEGSAKQALLDLCRLSPGYQLPAGFPPVFQRELEKAKKRLDKQPRGQIAIDGPAGATVYVDGRDLGMVPVVDENVPSGTHYVRVEGGKGERFGTAIEVKGGAAKVKASFGERVVVKPGEGPVADPRVGAMIDEGTRDRVAVYAKAASAEYALVGYVYKTSETQLAAGTALFSLKKGAFFPLVVANFDTDVMTANTEAFKLVDDVVKRLSSLGPPATFPLNLVTQAKAVVVAKTDPKRADDVDVVTPGATRTPKKVVLVPEPKPTPTVEIDKPGDPDKPVVKSGVPTWVWIVAGVAVAAGAGVGGYFGYTAATRPVTGTVTASW